MIAQEMVKLPAFNGERVLLLRLGTAAETWLVETESSGENLEVSAAQLRRPLFNQEWRSVSSRRIAATHG